MTISTRSCHSVLLVSALAASAWAQKLKPEAKVHFEAGSQAFEAKDYPGALSEFWVGYLMDPKRDFLYAIGQVYRAAGQCEKATAAYAAYKRTRPGRKKSAKADANIARCEDAPPMAVAQPAPPAPPPDPPPAAPPVEAKPPVEVEPRTVVVERERPPGPWYTDWVGDSLAVGGFVALGVGTFLWVGGRRDLADANKPGRYDDYATFTRDVEAASQKQTVGIVTFAAGGALVAGAALRWWLRAAPETEPKVSARPGPGGGMVFYTTRF